MQSCSIVVTASPDVRKALYPLHFEQKMVLEAPLVLTFCSDMHRMRRWLKLSDAPLNFDNFMSFMIGAIDAVLAAQNAALAAENEGLGICYMGTTLASCRGIAAVLELPENVVPVTSFVLGYPAENPGPRDRLPLDGIIHREKYQRYSDERIREIYQNRETAGWNRYMAFPGMKEKILESGAKNLAQIYTLVKYTRESHVEYSKNLLQCIKEHGFWNHES